MIGGPNDTGRGRWIPTTSVDQYAATLASWFGVSATNLPIVLPNIGRFATSNLGFLGVSRRVYLVLGFSPWRRWHGGTGRARPRPTRRKSASPRRTPCRTEAARPTFPTPIRIRRPRKERRSSMPLPNWPTSSIPLDRHPLGSPAAERHLRGLPRRHAHRQSGGRQHRHHRRAHRPQSAGLRLHPEGPSRDQRERANSATAGARPFSFISSRARRWRSAPPDPIKSYGPPTTRC